MKEETSPRPRKAIGPERPAYFTAADTDRVMAILLALISEVASIRDRLDSHERIAAGGVPATADLVEAYRPDDAAAAEREAWRHAYIRRLFRVITEDVEALQGGSIARWAVTDQESRDCFFEKKHQKTFAKLGFGLSGQAEAKMIKSFLLPAGRAPPFFQKKQSFSRFTA